MDRLFKEVLIHHEKFDKINVQLAFLNYLSCGLCIVERDKNLTIKYANQIFYSLLGKSLNQEDLLCFSNIILEKEFIEIIKEVQYQIKQEQTHIHFKIKVQHSPKAKWLLFECYNQPLMMEQMV